MEQVEILGRLCQLGSSDEIRELSENERQDMLLYVIRVDGKEYAGLDADKYPACEKPLLDFEIFGIGISWEWYDE